MFCYYYYYYYYYYYCACYNLSSTLYYSRINVMKFNTILSPAQRNFKTTLIRFAAPKQWPSLRSDLIITGKSVVVFEFRRRGFYLLHCVFTKLLVKQKMQKKKKLK
jgi:hypothetical protein